MPSVLDFSPFLRSLILEDIARFVEILSTNPTERLAKIVSSTAKSWRGSDEAELMASLRHARQEVALLVALADLGGVWDVEAVTAALTDFADAARRCGGALLLARRPPPGSSARQGLPIPEKDCGWIVLGMGKLGARELNYSSDIDLIVLYDRARSRLARPTRRRPSSSA